MNINKIGFMSLFLAIACIALPYTVFGQDNTPERIRIATAFGGVITNKYTRTESGNTIILKDSGFMTGAYFQWIETEMGQANFNGYWSPSVNYSRVLGLHGNADGYFLGGSWGNCVAGIDIEDINIDMDAGSHVSVFSSFKMKNNVLFMLARAGARFRINPSENISIMIFPYAGATRERESGKVEMVIPPMGPMPSIQMEEKFNDTDNYFSWGTNVNARVFQFTELTLKYLGRAKKNNYMHSIIAQASVFPSRNVVIAYQFRHMQLESGYIRYHMLNAGLMF